MAAGVTEVDFDFSDPEVNKNAHDYNRLVREAGPVVFNRAMQRWLIGGYEDVRRSIGDEEHFGPDREFFDTLFGARVFIAETNPRHNEMRSSWDRYFRRNAVEGRRSYMEGVVGERIDALAQRLESGEIVDFWSVVALDIPTRMITRLLGIAPEDVPDWQEWGEDISRLATDLTGPRAELLSLHDTAGFKAVQAMCAAAGEELVERRAGGQDEDLIGLLANSAAAAAMSEDELRGQIAFVFMAGHETTAKFITNALLVFDRHREQLQALVEDRTLLRQAVQEVIRYVGGVGPINRVARAGAQVGDVPIPDGDLVIALPTAANRDPRRWENPDEFDIFREQVPNIGFGFGSHVCLGQHLATSTAEIVLNEVCDRMPDYRVVERDEDLHYGTVWQIRAPTELHLKI